MTLFFCLLLAFAQPADTATAVVSCPPLLPPPGDNQPILQAFFDSLPPDTAISSPAGFHESIAVPGLPNLTHSGPARAFRSDDSERAFVKRIEGGK
jgi:hypothetical protein